MNKTKMKSLMAAGRKGYRNAVKKGLTGDHLLCAVDGAINERYETLFPELAKEDAENENDLNMLDLEEFQEAVVQLAKEGIPSCSCPDVDDWMEEN